MSLIYYVAIHKDMGVINNIASVILWVFVCKVFNYYFVLCIIIQFKFNFQ